MNALKRPPPFQVLIMSKESRLGRMAGHGARMRGAWPCRRRFVTVHIGRIVRRAPTKACGRDIRWALREGKTALGTTRHVLVTGSTENQGRAIIEGLRTRGHRLRALVRDPVQVQARRRPAARRKARRRVWMCDDGGRAVPASVKRPPDLPVSQRHGADSPSTRCRRRPRRQAEPGARELPSHQRGALPTGPAAVGNAGCARSRPSCRRDIPS